MSPPFRKAAVFAKPRTDRNRPGLIAAARSILEILARCGVEPMLEAETRDALDLEGYPGYEFDRIGREADLAVVLGGDGTMLGIARELVSYDVPLVGVHFGRLGFMTDIPLGEMTVSLERMLAGEFETERRTVLEAEVLRHGVVLQHGHALNDVVVSHGVAGGMLEFTVRVDGDEIYNQRADGVILATPTGSTAYALSANGPILHPSLAGLVLVPVAPHTLSNRPIALPDSVQIEIELTEVRDASAHFDMQSYASLEEGDVVRVRRCPRTVRLLHPPGYNYFATLRQKLHWNVMSSEERGRA
jgi:NAD+ kinase